MANKEVIFKGKIVREVYKADDFRVYGMNVSKDDYPDVKRNKYNNVGISGNLPVLDEGIEYEVVGLETMSKNGYSYKVLNIRRDVPKSKEDMFLFLQEILTENQANILFKHYPDIVERVKENRLDDIDLSKLNGIKEKRFEQIKNKIAENFCLADMVIEFQGYLNLPVLKKLYNKYTSIEMLKKRLREEPYKCLCGISGIGFKSADNILLTIEKISKDNVVNGKEPILDFPYDLRSSFERCLACIMYVLKENENEGHTKMNLMDLRKQCLELVPKCADYFVDAIKTDDIYYNKENLEVALKKTYLIEKNISEMIIYALGNDFYPWNYDTSKYREVDGFNLSDEQMNVVNNVCRYKISILNGAAGSGKSFSTQSVVNMVKDNKHSFAIMSPTGKAAKVVSEYTKEQASTIHRGLIYSPNGFYYKDGKEVERDNKDNKFYYKDNGQLVEGKPYNFYTPFFYNRYNKMNIDIVIVDEFSMVDIHLFQDLLDALDLSHTKLLLVGDNAQLPSVGCGNLLHDLMQVGFIPTTTLTKIFRYDDGGLMKVATDVRFCKKYLSNKNIGQVTTFGKNKDYVFIDAQSDKIPKKAKELYKKLLKDGYTINDIQVLTAKNVGDCGTIQLNNMIQSVANPNYNSYKKIHFGDIDYYEGDLVIQKENNYRAEIDPDSLSAAEKEFGEKQTAFVANGETGIITKISCGSDEYMIIDFDGIKVKYYRNNYKTIGLGYAITIHKSQGSSIKIPIICTPKSHVYMCNSNLLYVALTRMKEKCFHLGSLNTVNMSVKKKANLERMTFLQGLLTTSLQKE